MIAVTFASLVGWLFIAAGVATIAVFYVLASAGAETRSAILLVAGFLLLLAGWAIRT